MTALQQHSLLPNIIHFELTPTLGMGPGVVASPNTSSNGAATAAADAAVAAAATDDNYDDDCMNHINAMDKPFFDTYTLYLIRHGEAAHNILEKKAKKEELEKCLAEGLAADSPETKQRVNAAREEVLNNELLFDAKLSDQGKQEAHEAGQRLKELVKEYDLPPPEHVLVSPLTRTLETANFVFPENNDIHVREELRERLTGKPPDSRAPSASLMRRLSFKRFSMQKLRQHSIMNLKEKYARELDRIESGGDYESDDYDSDDQQRNDNDEQKNTTKRENDSPELPLPKTKRHRSTSVCSDGSETEEDKVMLRDRTAKLLHLLAEAQQNSVAVVTHKGYLRELERGPFGNSEATEFGNCEIRVYRVRLREDKSLEYAHRLV